MTGDRGGRLLQSVSISPQVESNLHPRVIRFSGLAPAPRTSINSAAQVAPRRLRKRPSNRFDVVSAHRHQRGWGLLRGGRTVASLDVVKTSTRAAGSRGPRGRRGGRGDPTEDAAIIKLSQSC